MLLPLRRENEMDDAQLSGEKIDFGALREGANTYKTRDGKVVFTSHVSGGQVTAFSATDSEGKPLRVEVKSSTLGLSFCEVCVWLGPIEYCYKSICRDVTVINKNRILHNG